MLPQLKMKHRIATWVSLLAIGAGSRLNAADSPSQGPVLTTAHQVLELGLDRARALHRPVRVRGTLLTVSRVPVHLVVHDGTECVLAVNTNWPPGLAVGKWVEIEGRTDAGLQTPVVDQARVTILGDSTIPAATPISSTRVIAGEGCWQWVRIEGVIRDMNRDRSNLALAVASEGRRFTAFLYDYNRYRVDGLPLEWLEARVQLDGVCWTDVNDWNEPVEFHLGMFNTNQVHLLTPGTTNVFDRPLLRSHEGTRLREPSDIRLKVAGTVVARLADDRVFLDTEWGPVQGRLAAPISRGPPGTEVVPRNPPVALEPGDRVEMVGAPAPSMFAPVLLDAECTHTGRGSVPPPAPASPRTLARGSMDARAVRVTARLLSRERRPAGRLREEALTLEADDQVFDAVWRSPGTHTLPDLPLDARVAVDGVCVVDPGPSHVRHNFKILLHAPGDVRYLGPSPVWEMWPLRRIAAMGVVVAGGAAAWILALRRRVRERTAALVRANEQIRKDAARLRESALEVERALAKEKELNQLKSHFVTTVSHEFRTPLGVILSSSDLLEGYLDRLSPERRAELLADIRASTRRMSALMEEVLFLSRSESGRTGCRRETVRLDPFCQSLADEVRSATAGRCPIRVQAPDLAGSVDPALLRHILSNLLGNAVKYSPEGSEVTLEVYRAGRELVIEVADHGIGIPEQEIGKLFEPFHRASNVGAIPGTGLGLTIVKRCVDLHGGAIECRSPPGEGTRFVVRLPAFEEL